jgi:hypothetical protein
MDYDPELPDGLQSADLEMSDLERTGRKMSELKKRGICFHNWTIQPPGQEKVTCNDCGKIFPSRDAVEEDYDRLKGEYL